MSLTLPLLINPARGLAPSLVVKTLVTLLYFFGKSLSTLVRQIWSSRPSDRW